MAELQITIGDESSLRQKMMCVWEMVCKGIKSGPVVVTLGRPARSGAQNRHFQALISEIAQQVEVGSQKYSQDVWRALLVDQFEQAMQEAGTPISKPGRTVPSLDGRRAVTVRPSTTGLKKREAAEFIEYLYSEGIEMGVKFTPPAVEIYEKYRECQNDQN